MVLGSWMVTAKSETALSMAITSRLTKGSWLQKFTRCDRRKTVQKAVL